LLARTTTNLTAETPRMPGPNVGYLGVIADVAEEARMMRVDPWLAFCL